MNDFFDPVTILLYKLNPGLFSTVEIEMQITLLLFTTLTVLIMELGSLEDLLSTTLTSSPSSVNEVQFP